MVMSVEGYVIGSHVYVPRPKQSLAIPLPNICGTRHHVHLSPDYGTANKDESRNGKPSATMIDCRKLLARCDFFLSYNVIRLSEESCLNVSMSNYISN